MIRVDRKQRGKCIDSCFPHTGPQRTGRFLDRLVLSLPASPTGAINPRGIGRRSETTNNNRLYEVKRQVVGIDEISTKRKQKRYPHVNISFSLSLSLSLCLYIFHDS